MNHSQRTVRELYDLTASTAPTPGGGVVTALSAMLGVSLILKAARITRRHGEQPELDAVEPRLEHLAAAFERDADADSQAFARFIQAAKLPKTTAAESAARREQMDQAAAASAQAAIDTLQHARSAVRLTRRIRCLVSPVMAPDITAGMRLLHVARRNAVDNARGNLEGVGPGPERDRLLGMLERLGRA